MDIIKKYITQNDCYKANRSIVVKGIMLHSVGIVADIIPEGWFQRWNKPGIDKAVHYFVDENTCLQVLPDSHRGWHAGASANNTHVSFEICEKKPYTDKEYAVTMFKRAVELCVHLCKKHNLKASDIISHAEGYKKGIASNHGDPDHWWRQHGLTMDKLRKEVDAILNPPAAAPPIKEGVKTFMIELEVLKRGSKGEQVKTIQRLLRMLGFKDQYGNILVIDGDFGTRTDHALRAFQKSEGLVVDGSCGPKTWAALLK